MKVEELRSELDRRIADRAKEGKVFDNTSSMGDEQVLVAFGQFVISTYLVKNRWGQVGPGPSNFGINQNKCV